MRIKGLECACAVALAIGATVSAHAARTTVGPFLDLKAEVSPSEQVVGGSLSTSSYTYLLGIYYPPPLIPLASTPVTHCAPPTPNCYWIHVSDNISWYSGGTDYPWRVAGVSYISSDTELPADTVRLNTVYGIDLQPGSTSVAITGFDLSAPHIGFESEKVFGAAGEVYSADYANVVQLSELGAVLGAGADLSPFQGAASSGVYVFGTTLPTSALVVTVPEPQTFLMLTCGLAGLAWRTRATRRARPAS